MLVSRRPLASTSCRDSAIVRVPTPAKGVALSFAAFQSQLARRVKAEPPVPERASARVASKPRKTYAEDDVPLDDEERRDAFVGTPG